MAIAAVDEFSGAIVGLSEYVQTSDQACIAEVAGAALHTSPPSTIDPKDTDMIAPHLTIGIAKARIDAFRRNVDARTVAHRRAEPSRTFNAERRSVTLRLGSPSDERAVGLLAALDSSTPPARPLLLADADGQPLAALALSDGSVVADPFQATADLIDLLRARARQLDGDHRMRSPGRLRSWARPRTAGGC